MMVTPRRGLNLVPAHVGYDCSGNATPKEMYMYVFMGKDAKRLCCHMVLAGEKKDEISKENVTNTYFLGQFALSKRLMFVEI